VDSNETLEALLRRVIRDVVHDEVRAQIVSDAPLSEAARSSCARDNPMTRAEAASEESRG